MAAGLPNEGGLVFRRVVGVALVIAAGGVVLVARRRWIAVDRAMRRGKPLPTSSMLHALSWLPAALAALAVAAVVVALV